MSLDSLKQFQPSGFAVPRFADKEIVEQVNALAKEGDYKIEKCTVVFIFSEQSVEFQSTDTSLDQVFCLNSVTARKVTFTLKNALQIGIERGWNNDLKKLTGNQDWLFVSPTPRDQSQSQVNALDYAKLIALARKHFKAVDTKPFMDFLEEGPKQLYQSREQDLQRLERMQEELFKRLGEFTLDQHKKQQEFQQKLETEYASRQTNLEAQHQERLTHFEEKEAELKKIRSEIDERENRQARRDIYKEIKVKLDARNKTFELTEGTKNRRRFTFGFTMFLLLVFGGIFAFCFYKNVASDSDKINWVAVGSQIGFAFAFIGVATFFIRWNNQWFQKHADEEFKLKRLDLDIDRANWLVELAMEWKNITKSEISPELIDKLSRSLFVSDETKEFDIHPAETLLSAIFGKAGNINVEFPGKVTMQRNTDEANKKSSRKE